MSMGMGAIGGPPAGMNMNMNGGAPPPRGAPSSNDKTLLNTYIYDYFLKNGYIECARSLINEADISTTPNSQRNSPSRRAQKHDSDGNAVNGDDNAMDTGEGPSQRKNEDPDDPNKDRADGLPLPKLPANCPQGSFLFDWWCLFWDIFGARNGVGKSSIAAGSYVTQTQATQRFRQEQLLRQMNPQQQHALMTGQVPSQLMNLGNQQYRNQMMQMQSGVLPNGAMNQDSAGGGEMSMQNKNLLARTAMMNNNRKTPLQIAGLKTQQHMMVQAAMQRESGEINDMNGQQPRPQSPAAGHNAGSPKRMRLENGQYQEVGNGRGAPQGTPQSAASASQAHQLLMANGIDPNRLTPQQFQAFQGQNPITQQKSIQLYAQNLAAHAGRAVTALQGGPPKGMANAQQNPPHGAPMMPQTSEGAPLGMSDFYATTPGGMRAGGMGAGTGNHALQDYQMQLMLLEQQNKKRLAMARAEQDSIAHHSDGQRRMEQGFSQSMSPNSRAAPSPQTPGNPKMTGTPKMPNQGGPGSPMPEGPMPGHVQQRNSPAAMGFNGQLQQGGQQDMMYNEMKNSLGIMGNANPGGAPNGGTMMRPPSSHPGFAAQMSQVEMNQMNANLRAQAGRGVPVGNVWQQTQQQQQQLQMQQQAQVAAQQQAAQQAQQQAAQQAQQQQQQQQQQAQQQAQQQQAGGPQSGQPQAQIGTPQPARQNLPHQTMPPPPSVPPGAPTNARTQPSSPQVAVQQPPTPTQSHKANPKGKAGREAGKKKNGGAAPQPTGPVGTPSSEPPTPTTPQHQNSFSQNPRPVSFAPGQNVAGQPPQQPTPNPAHAAPPAPVPGPADVGAGFLGGEGDINLDFAGFPGDPSDNLLDTFDFDSFLNTEDTNGSIGYDGIGGWSNDTVEASAGES